MKIVEAHIVAGTGKNAKWVKLKGFDLFLLKLRFLFTPTPKTGKALLVIPIKEDKDLYYGWQSNIAMAFKDKYYNYKKKKNKRWLNREDIHEIANEAAKDFLNLLIRK